MPPPPPRRAALPLLLAGLPPLLAWSPLAAQQSWTLTPELRIGSVDDPRTALTRIGDIAVGEDGTMYVSQPQQKEVRIYSRAGDLLRIIGGEGGGPGEFQNVSSLFWRADTLLVLDTPQQRLTAFAPSGDLIRTFRPLPLASQRRHVVRALFPDGSLYGRPQSANRVPRSPLLRIRDETPPDTLAWVSTGRAAFRADLGPGCVIATWHPLPVGDLLDIDPRAVAVTVVEQPPAKWPDSAYFYVRRIGPDGAMWFDRRFRYRPHPLSEEELAKAFEIIRRSLARLRDPACRPARLDRFLQEELDLPKYHPPVSALVIGRDGTTWLRLHEGEARHQWLVLDERGDVLARLSVPPAVRILTADQEHVWGMELDPLDVPYLVRYRVGSGR